MRITFQSEDGSGHLGDLLLILLFVLVLCIIWLLCNESSVDVDYFML
jgi:hypothetical protein